MRKKIVIENIKKQINKDRKRLERLIFIRLLLGCVALFLIAITFIVRPVYIDGKSMYPTLDDKDVGLSNIATTHIKKFKRFDIVMAYSKEEKTYVAKRIIALPNETIQYRDDVLYINNETVFESFLDVEYIKNQTSNGEIKFTDDFGPKKLKEGEYFLVGDNRRISKDSRVLGSFQLNDIVSKGIFVLYSAK